MAWVVGVEVRLLRVVAISARQVAERAGGLGHYVGGTGKGVNVTHEKIFSRMRCKD